MEEMTAYIETFPEHVRVRMYAIRALIHRLVPDIQERMSWQMPTFYLNGNLAHFAGYGRHIGFYPGESGIAAFEAELAPYKHAKGSVQFPHDKPLPIELIEKIVIYREKQQRQADKKVKA